MTWLALAVVSFALRDLAANVPVTVDLIAGLVVTTPLVGSTSAFFCSLSTRLSWVIASCLGVLTVASVFVTAILVPFLVVGLLIGGVGRSLYLRVPEA